MNSSLFVAELLGTLMLVWLGDGVVANVVLKKSGMFHAGGGATSVQITLAWAAAVAVPVALFGGVSGAHFNPAVTIAVALNTGDWSQVPFYIIAQMVGAFLGACLVWLQYKTHLDAEDGPVLGVFSTGPSMPNTTFNFISEFLATFALLFCILAVPGDVGDKIGPLYIFIVIMSMGMSFGGVTGYALNPARDLGPRIAHALLPIKGKGGSDWGYAWIPVVAPICGGVAAYFVYSAIKFIF